MNVSVSEVTQLDDAITALGRSFVHLGLLERIGVSPAIVEGCHARALSYAQPNGRAGPSRPVPGRIVSARLFQLGRSWKPCPWSIARPPCPPLSVARLWQSQDFMTGSETAVHMPNVILPLTNKPGT